MNSEIVLEAHNLSIGYPKHTVSHDINIVLFSRELVCLIGPNGAGKTTLLRTLAGMLSPVSGQVKLLGEDVRHLASRLLAQRLSVVLTDRVDVGLLSGYALVALGRHPYTDWTGNLSKHDESVVRWAVEAVSASEIAQRPVNELSDGERQKLMIARALAQEPAVMILDEPTAYLDLPRRVEIVQLLRQIARQTNRAILLSTHDLDLALRTADRIWLMPGDAKLSIGAPEDLVLNGAFEAAFQSAGVQFDQQTGSFSVKQLADSQIALQGEGVRYVWTERALKRAGYILDDDAEICVLVNSDNWILRGQETEVVCDTIYRLLAELSSA